MMALRGLLSILYYIESDLEDVGSTIISAVKLVKKERGGERDIRVFVVVFACLELGERF